MKTTNSFFTIYRFCFLIPCALTLMVESLVWSQDQGQKSEDLTLWYDQPAQFWMRQALPIGNAYMGAMVFGGIEKERIQFNEESLWAGGPGEWDQYNGGNRLGAHQFLPQVRELLDAGEFEKAHLLADKELTGVIIRRNEEDYWEGYGAYQTFGDIHIETKLSGEISNYHRNLDIANAIANVSFQSGDVLHKRHYFANYPSRVLVFQIENSAPSGTDYTIELSSVHQNNAFQQKDNTLIFEGALENNQMGFQAQLHVQIDQGSIDFNENKINIQSANKVTLRLTAATDYLNQYPQYKGRDYKKLNDATMMKAISLSHDDLFQEHQKDYQALFHRVHLDLGDSNHSHLPTNERLLRYRSGASDAHLEELYFQYGRYLLISSSRPGSLPANLQGKWNDKVAPPWAADYHMNINQQMLYWPAEKTNLSETHQPLLHYIQSLVEPGRKSAQAFFNASGWIVSTMNNPFGFTALGWRFPWGFFPGGAAWLTQHLWKHYAYNLDKNYLEKMAYPVMKEAAEFWLDVLIEDENGYLVSSPSYSPEHGTISTGAFMDIQMIWDLFTNLIEASQALGKEDAFYNQIVAARKQLLPLQIGRWGQLQEWKEDVDDPDNKHRHVSHLFALHPGRQIDINTTPDLAEAARISLEARGDSGTGWSLGWKINFWARLQNGNRAYQLFRYQLRPTEDEGYNYLTGGGTYHNLLSAHPPFQLDGNMGGTSGIAEMLLQSHNHELLLLPALPDEWANGSISGLKTKGNFEVSMQWKNNTLTRVSIVSNSGALLELKYSTKEISMETQKGNTYHFDSNLDLIDP